MARGIVNGVYLLTEDGADDARLAAVVPLALASGVKWLQFRDKSRDAVRRRRQADRLAEWCRLENACFIINDDVVLARDVGAAGVHLGEHDGAIESARDLLGPGAVIGASCYNDLDRAERASRAGADYLAFGAMYPSGTKPLARACPLSTLTEARRFGLPVVAIGGIGVDEAGNVKRAGADAIAVIGAIWQSADVADTTRRLRAVMS